MAPLLLEQYPEPDRSISIFLGLVVIIISIFPLYWIYGTYGLFAMITSTGLFYCLCFIQVYIYYKRKQVEDESVKYLSKHISEKRKVSLWPTSRLKDEVELYKDNKPVIAWPLDSELRDVTDETADQILEFLPDIEMFGVDLWLDSLAYFGGVLARVLQKEGDDGKARRCIQYVFTFTKQGGVLGFIWWPIVLFSIGYSLLYLELWIVAAIFFPLIPIGLYYSFQFRGLVQFVLAQFIPYSLLVIGFLFPDAGPWFLIILGVLVLFLVPQISERLSLTHPMDYLPVFIWIEEDIESEFLKWKITSACWDSLHYKTRIIERPELENHIRDDTVLCLVMDNLWHSVKLGGIHKERNPIFNKISRLFLIASPYLILASYYMFDTIIFVAISWVILFSIFYSANGPFRLARSEIIAHLQPQIRNMRESSLDFKNIQVAHEIFPLSKTLETLWNLHREIEHEGKMYRDDAPSLKIVTKMQNPFKYHEEGKFTSFRDDAFDLYTEIKQLRDEFEDTN